MTEQGSGRGRRAESTPPAEVPETSVVPGRVRIVAWILLATALGLAAVVVTLRSTALAEIEREANSDVAQEVDEFRTFARTGRDPDTGAAFDDAQRMLELHLQRQFPGRDELLLGWDPAAPAGDGALLRQDVADPVGLAGEPALVRELAEGAADSGVATTSGGTAFRWGRVPVDASGGPGVFLVAVGTTEDRAEVDRQLAVVAAVCLAGLAFTAAIAWVVAGAILRPVRLVRRAAARLTRNDLGERIPVTGRDDVSALAATFNGMLDRLDRAFRAQTRFTTSAGAHLRPALDLVRERTAHDPQAQAAVDRMEAILTDLEVLAASERAGFATLAPASTGEVLDALAARARHELGGDHPVEVTHRDDVVVDLDAARVEDAVVRLVRNAAQQSPAGAPVRLSCRVVGDRVELAVSDLGAGLTPEAAARAVERYGESAGGTGPGLGLAVVRAVADAHDGSLFVETAPGEGATFGVALPLRAGDGSGVEPELDTRDDTSDDTSDGAADGTPDDTSDRTADETATRGDAATAGPGEDRADRLEVTR